MNYIGLFLKIKSGTDLPGTRVPTSKNLNLDWKNLLILQFI